MKLRSLAIASSVALLACEPEPILPGYAAVQIDGRDTVVTEFHPPQATPDAYTITLLRLDKEVGTTTVQCSAPADSVRAMLPVSSLPLRSVAIANGKDSVTNQYAGADTLMRGRFVDLCTRMYRVAEKGPIRSADAATRRRVENLYRLALGQPSFVEDTVTR